MIRDALVGNIAFSKADAIVQGIAADEDFSQGVALAVSQKYPGIVEDFAHFRATTPPQPGGLWVWHDGASRNIVSLFIRAAAADHRGTAKLEWLDRALSQLRELAQRENFRSIALPRLGTGAGDLDWRDVKPLIQKHLGDLPAKVFLYTIYNPHIAGVEE